MLSKRGTCSRPVCTSSTRYESRQFLNKRFNQTFPLVLCHFQQFGGVASSAAPPNGMVTIFALLWVTVSNLKPKILTHSASTGVNKWVCKHFITCFSALYPAYRPTQLSTCFMSDMYTMHILKTIPTVYFSCHLVLYNPLCASKCDFRPADQHTDLCVLMPISLPTWD